MKDWKKMGYEMDYETNEHHDSNKMWVGMIIL